MPRLRFVSVSIVTFVDAKWQLSQAEHACKPSTVQALFYYVRRRGEGGGRREEREERRNRNKLLVPAYLSLGGFLGLCRAFASGLCIAVGGFFRFASILSCTLGLGLLFRVLLSGIGDLSVGAISHGRAVGPVGPVSSCIWKNNAVLPKLICSLVLCLHVIYQPCSGLRWCEHRRKQAGHGDCAVQTPHMPHSRSPCNEPSMARKAAAVSLVLWFALRERPRKTTNVAAVRVVVSYLGFLPQPLQIAHGNKTRAPLGRSCQGYICSATGRRVL